MKGQRNTEGHCHDFLPPVTPAVFQKQEQTNTKEGVFARIKI